MVKINNIKDIFTDLIGAVLMVGSSYFLYKEKITMTNWGILMGVGFVLLWMSDKEILDFLKRIINGLIGIFLKKAEGIKPPTDKEDKPE